MMLCAGPGNVLVGSDYSGQEMRMAAHASNDPDMIGAYAEGKDLYSIVACAMFNNKYEDNLEFYPEGTKINFEGQEIIAGNDNIYIEDIENNTFTILNFRLVETILGMVAAESLKLGDILITDEGNKKIKNIQKDNNLITIELES